MGFDLLSIQPDTQAEILVRVALAALLGGIVGFEREFSDQPAGLRTHLLVSLGAALFSMAGAFAGTDPTRIAAQVAAGIGFIGAGVIFQQGLNVRGLTTAAALWVTAAIGTAVAFGLWVAATGSTIITVVALYGLKRFELWIFGHRKAEGDDSEDEGG
ncbi:MAG TPA: MgtC/SapB family protein [Actinomycetota bacterium]|nr:MgtC/SapB family protein [Actinomycetota bacterium]